MSYKIYDLSQPFGYMGPGWPHVASPGRPITRPGPSGLLRGLSHTSALHRGQTRRVSIYSGGLHSGTHIDAPNHEREDAPSCDKIPLENCYGTGVVVDFRYMKKWHRITAEDFEKATPKIEPGDLVVCNTGWQKWWWVKEYVYHNHYPGLVPSGAEWLVKKKVKAWAGTCGSLDHPLAYYPMEAYYPWRLEEYMKETGKHPHEEFPTYEPCHHILCTNDILAIENAGGDIDLVTGMRCTIAAFPARLVGTSGHQMRLVAILEE